MRLADDPWESIVSALMDEKPALGAVMQHGSPIEVSARKIVLGFSQGSFFGRQAATDSARGLVAAAAERVLGARPEIEVTFHEGSAPVVKTIVEIENERRDARMQEARQRALNHPIVMEAAALFSFSQDVLKVHVELE